MSDRALIVLIVLAAAAVGGAYYYAQYKKNHQTVAAGAPAPALGQGSLPNNTLPFGTKVDSGYVATHLGSYARNPDGSFTVSNGVELNSFRNAGKTNTVAANTAPPTQPTQTRPVASVPPSSTSTPKPPPVGSTFNPYDPATCSDPRSSVSCG